MIEIQNITVSFQQRTVLKNISLAFDPGKINVIVGPNGSGKSTLLRSALGMIPIESGKVLYDGVSLDEMSVRGIARKCAYLPQGRNIPSIKVRNMVLHSRFAYLSYPRRYTKEDYRIVDEALCRADAFDLADLYMETLSGGQRQKVYIAMALAQNTETIIMDEPTTYLDIDHQLGLMEASKKLAQDGKAVVLVLHDLCLAMRVADIITILSNGHLQITDNPEKVFQSAIINQEFGVSFKRFKTDSGWHYFYD